jgi:hypothetical protein
VFHQRRLQKETPQAEATAGAAHVFDRSYVRKDPRSWVLRPRFMRPFGETEDPTASASARSFLLCLRPSAFDSPKNPLHLLYTAFITGAILTFLASCSVARSLYGKSSYTSPTVSMMRNRQTHRPVPKTHVDYLQYFLITFTRSPTIRLQLSKSAANE